MKVVYFPAGRFVDSPEGLALVKAWGDAGHVIGNHTYSHTDIDTLTVAEYTADIARGDALFRRLPNFKPRLRFPFLREGSTQDKRDGVRDWLTKHGYDPAPVSIVTSDWYWNQRLVDWAKAHPDGNTEPFRKAYLQHVWDRAEYSERLARELLGRSPAHVMLLHANRVNAMYLAEVLAMFRAKGWNIAAADEAFADPLYRQLPKGLPAGNGLLAELTKDAGAQASFLRQRGPWEGAARCAGLLASRCCWRSRPPSRRPRTRSSSAPIATTRNTSSSRLATPRRCRWATAKEP